MSTSMGSGQLTMQIFERQSILAQKSEPFDVAPAVDVFLVASANGIISAYSATSASNQSENRLIHRFQAVQPYILSIRYNPSTDSIITLEREVEEHSRQAIRIYSNWRVGTPSPIPIAVQDSSVVPEGVPQSAMHIIGFTPVLGETTKPLQPTPRAYTLPLSMSATAVSVCQSTNLMVIACHKIVTVWMLYQHTITLKKPSAPKDDNTSATLPANLAGSSLHARLSHRGQLSFMGKSFRSPNEKKSDAEEKTVIVKARPVFDVESSWEVRVLALEGNYITYGCFDQVRILKFSTSENTFASEDDTVMRTEISFLPGEVRNQDRASEVVRDSYCFECEFDTQGNSIIPVNPDSVMKVPSIPEARASRNASFEYFGPVTDTDCGMRVYGRYQVNEFTLLVYRRFPSSSTIQSLWFITDPSDKNIIRALVSTEKQAFVYDLQEPKLFATYNFLSESNTVIPSQFFLYNLSQTALEVYTMRWSSAVSIEYIPAPFMLTRQLFIGLLNAAVVDDHILLLSKQLDDGIEFTRFRIHSSGLKAPSSPASSLGASTPSSYGTKKMASRSPHGFFPSGLETSQSNDETAEPQAAGWNLYVLSHNQIPMIYNELIAASLAFKEAMPTRHHQMILEGFFLLKSRLVYLYDQNSRVSSAGNSLDPRAMARQVDIDTCTSLIRKCSSQLATIYFGAADYKTAAKYYAMSDMKVSDVVDIFSDSRTNFESLISYLNVVLFDPSMQDYVDDTPELADRVLSIYRQYSAHQLASVILKSSLTNYNQTSALELFESLIDEMESKKSRTDESALHAQAQHGLTEVKFVRGLLLLDLGAVHEAGLCFESLEPKALSDLVLTLSSCLHSPDDDAAAIGGGSVMKGSDSHQSLHKLAESEASASWTLSVVEEVKESADFVPSLSEVLRKYAPWPLLDAVMVMTEDDHDWIRHYSILQSRQEEKFPSSRLLQECYLEAILLGSPGLCRDMKSWHQMLREQDIEFVYVKLLRLYITRLLHDDERDCDAKKLIFHIGASSRETSEKSTVQSDDLEHKWMRFHTTSFSFYPEWFDLIDEPTEGVNRPVKQMYRRKLHSLLVHVYQIGQQKLADEHLEYGLSGTGFLAIMKALSAKAIQVLESTPKAFPGKERAITLCLPMSGRLSDGLGRIIPLSLEAAVDYAKYCCKTSTEWKSVVDLLLSTHAKAQSEKSIADRVRSVLCKVLDHLTSVMLPSEFLQILPSDGNMAFYLPYIHRIIQHNKALDIRRAIVNDAKKQVAQDESA